MGYYLVEVGDTMETAKAQAEDAVIKLIDAKGEVKQVKVKEICIDSNFDSIVINYKDASENIKKYFLRRTKRDRLVLT